MGKESIKASESTEKINRKKLMNISSWTVESIKARLNSDRFREREGDKTKLQYLRVLIQALQTHNSILRDQELEDIKSRLDRLESGGYNANRANQKKDFSN